MFSLDFRGLVLNQLSDLKVGEGQKINVADIKARNERKALLFTAFKHSRIAQLLSLKNTYFASKIYTSGELTIFPKIFNPFCKK